MGHRCRIRERLQMIRFFIWCQVAVVLAGWIDLSIPGYPKRADLACSTCDIVAKAIEKELLAVDEKQTILLGGRLEGGEAHKKIKYARSEAHLIDVMEKLCENLPHQAAVALKRNQWKFITDAQKHDWDAEKKAEKEAEETTKKDEEEGTAGEDSHTKPAPEPTKTSLKTGFDKVFGVGDESKKLRSCCEKFLAGDVEDALIAYLHNNWSANLDLRNKLCVDISKSCPTRTRKSLKSEGKEKTDL